MTIQKGNFLISNLHNVPFKQPNNTSILTTKRIKNMQSHFCSSCYLIIQQSLRGTKNSGKYLESTFFPPSKIRFTFNYLGFVA
jgi:hypothetical protein